MRTEPITQSEHRYLRGPESREAHRIITRLREEGFVAYMAGGCVRDALLGKAPKDYDVATDATPQSVRELFGKSRTLAFGASFGVIGVLPPRGEDRDPKAASTQPTEVATFRSDGDYSDGRRPDSVHFGDAEQDALRRDFTINGLFYDPDKDAVIDYVGGEEDLNSGLLRTIGDPLARFGEDKLRMLRAVRFATTLGFRIDDPTRQAIIEHADDIALVSGERIGAEMRRVMSDEHAVMGLEHLIACGLDRVVMPEIVMADMERLEALIRHSSLREFSLSLAFSLLTSDPKGETPWQDSLRAITARWKLSNEETRKVTAALKHWRTIVDARALPWSSVQPVLTDRDATMIVQLASAVVGADDMDAGGVTLALEALGWPAQQLDPPPLLTGDDLRQLGIPAGPHYRIVLQSIRDAQLDGKIASREEAIEMTR